jgi:hypothetical protein
MALTPHLNDVMQLTAVLLADKVSVTDMFNKLHFCYLTFYTLKKHCSSCLCIVQFGCSNCTIVVVTTAGTCVH